MTDNVTASVHAKIHTDIRRYLRTCRSTDMRMYMGSYAWGCRHAYVRTCRRAYVCTYISTYVRTYVRTYAHTHVCLCLCVDRYTDACTLQLPKKNTKVCRQSNAHVYRF